MKARWWWLFGMLFMVSAYAEVSVPELKQRVTDLTETLNAAQIQTLEAKLAGFESKKGSQIGVLIVPTTQPETIEQYSIRVVEQWKLGRKGVDGGVLLLIAKNDRKLRIEVGRGLEGGLNDATAKRIIAEIITPAFKQGDYAGGIAAGTDSIIKVVNGEVLPPPPKVEHYIPEQTPLNPVVLIILGLTLLAFVSFFISQVTQPSTPALNGVNIGGVDKPKQQEINYSKQTWLYVLLEVLKVVIAVSGSRSGGGFSGGGGGFSGGGSSGSW
ncbi:MAG: YgcG family protein [Gallionella sp.]|nr:YgcG family protein [Gallionella sp.]MDD4960218.1 YgcG family protein [Gallionella sp.]